MEQHYTSTHTVTHPPQFAARVTYHNDTRKFGSFGKKPKLHKDISFVNFFLWCQRFN
jgi:hypothetical protein